MLKTKLEIVILIIMSTFYMSGCISNNDDAIDYFENRYFAVEKIIDLDNYFQDSLDSLISYNPGDTLITEFEFEAKITNVKKNLDSLKVLINNYIDANFTANNEDENLDKAFKSLLNTYQKVIENEYSELLKILVSEDDSTNLELQFSKFYQAASGLLNEQVINFYSVAEKYGKEHHIEFNWE